MQSLADKNNGYLFTADVQKNGISRTYLAEFVSENNFERVSNGVYISPDTWIDELFILQHRYPKVVFANETALYLQGLSDREYQNVCVAVPPRFSSTALREEGVFIWQEKKEIYSLGIVELKTNFGNTVRVYDKEKCICDIVKRRSKIDIVLFSDAIKAYMHSRLKDLSKLAEYSEKMEIKDEIMKYIEVML